MSASRKSRAPIHHIDILPPERRHEEIVALFATGLERLILGLDELDLPGQVIV